jgi:hypothetical protein
MTSWPWREAGAAAGVAGIPPDGAYEHPARPRQPADLADAMARISSVERALHSTLWTNAASTDAPLRGRRPAVGESRTVDATTGSCTAPRRPVRAVLATVGGWVGRRRCSTAAVRATQRPRVGDERPRPGCPPGGWPTRSRRLGDPSRRAEGCTAGRPAVGRSQFRAASRSTTPRPTGSAVRRRGRRPAPGAVGGAGGVPAGGDGDQLQQPLDGTHEPAGAGVVVQHQQGAAGPQHPASSPGPPGRVGEDVQRQGAHHGVERGGRERQRVRVAYPQSRRPGRSVRRGRRRGPAWPG